MLIFSLWFALGKPSVLAVKPSRNILLKLHSEYTSITDELENVCHMITSPTVSIPSRASLDKPKSELTKAELAALLEKQHLKECEENDYMMLEGLFQARSSLDGTEQQYTVGMSIDYTHRYPLRRETAIELSPSKPTAESVIVVDNKDSGSDAVATTSAAYQLKNERPWQRIASMEQQQTNYQASTSGAQPTRAVSDFLNPPYEGVMRHYKKSCESLQKNSSTETDYSAHPYRFIKQSSNETTTSMTGSYNIDTHSLTAEASIDATDVHVPGLTTTNTICTTTTSTTTTTGGSGSGTGTSSASGSGMLAGANISRYQPLRTSSMGAADIRRRREDTSTTSSLDYTTTTTTAAPRTLQLKKQFSQIVQSRPHSPLQQQQQHQQPQDSQASVGKTTSKLLHTVMSTLRPPPTSKPDLSALKESNSSTDDSKDTASVSEVATVMPQISTDLVQDEIAKLSSNIKSSTESEKEKDPPYNETMC